MNQKEKRAPSCSSRGLVLVDSPVSRRKFADARSQVGFAKLSRFVRLKISPKSSASARWLPTGCRRQSATSEIRAATFHEVALREAAYFRLGL